MGNHNNISVFFGNGIKFVYHLHRSELTGLDIANFLNENEFCNTGCLLVKLMELETPFSFWSGHTNDSHPLAVGEEYEIKMINKKIYINNGDFTGTPEEYINYQN